MAGQVAPAPNVAQVLKFQPAAGGIRGYDRNSKIDQMGVVGCVSLQTADAVRIVTGIAGRIFVDDVLPVHPLPK